MARKSIIFLIGLLLLPTICYSATITSAGIGGWGNGATWVGGVTPVDGDVAVIANTHTVTINEDAAVGTNGAAGTDAVIIQSGGTLTFQTSGAWSLTCEGDIEVQSGGALTAAPDSATRQGIAFQNLAADGDYSVRVASGSKCILTGSGTYNNTNNVYRTKTATAVVAGAGTIVVDDSTSWIGNDEIVVSGTTGTTAEKKTISSVSGTIITISGTFTSAHAVDTVVVNLTRNFYISGEATPGYTDVYLDGTTSGNIDWDFVEVKNCGKWGGGYGIGVGLTTASTNVNLDDVTSHTGNGYNFYFYQGAINKTYNRLISYQDDGQSTSSSSIRLNAISYNTFNNGVFINKTANYNFEIQNKCISTKLDTNWIYDGARSGLLTSVSSGGNFVDNEIFNAASYGIETTFNFNDIVTGGFIGNNSSSLQTVLGSNGGEITLDNVLLYDNGYTKDAGTVGFGNGVDSKIYVQKFNTTAGDHRYYWTATAAQTSVSQFETTTVHTAGNNAIKMDLYAGDIKDFEITFDIPCVDNDVVTLWGYYRKSSAAANWTTSPTVTLVADEASPDIDGTATISDVTDTWAYFSMGGTKSGDGYVRITLKARLSAGTGDCFFDDIKAMIGSTVYDIGQLWTKGFPTVSLSALTTTAEGLWKVDISGVDYDTAGSAADYLKDTYIKADDAGVLGGLSN